MNPSLEVEMISTFEPLSGILRVIVPDADDFIEELNRRIRSGAELSSDIKHPNMPLEMKTIHESKQIERVVRQVGLHRNECGCRLLGRTRAQRRAVTPIDVFMLLWNEELVVRVVGITNDRIIKYSGNPIKPPQDGDKSGTYVAKSSEQLMTVDEFYTFCGVILLMGQLSLHRERTYWEEDCHGTGEVAQIIHAIQHSMRYDRFSFLRKYICFNIDTSVDEGSHNRLDMIIRMLFTPTANFYQPECHLSLDDQSFRCFAKCPLARGLRQRKANTRAIQLASLNDDKGVTLAMSLMRKKRSQGTSDLDPDYENPRSSRIASMPGSSRNDMVIDLFNRGLSNTVGYYTVMDSEFTNEELFDRLAEMGVLCTGTARRQWITRSSPELRLGKDAAKSFSPGMCPYYTE